MPLLPRILERLTESDPRYGEGVRAFVASMDDLYYENAESFFARYATFMERTGRSVDFGVTCFYGIAPQHGGRRGFISSVPASIPANLSPK